MLFRLLYTAFFALLVVEQIHADDELNDIAKRFFSPLPVSMPGSEQDTPAMIELGQALYFETALSVNGKQSCNSCHNLNDGGAGVDQLATSPGALGSPGTRNSPTTWNAGLQFAQFWDARAQTLEEQAQSPILNPIEMALPSKEEALRRLDKAGYRSKFEAVFQQQNDPFSFDKLLIALAAFQRTLITEDRFDDYLRGNLDALTIQEKRGLKRFIWIGCNACHNGPLLGGNSIMRLGIASQYPNKSDKGRAQVTGKSTDNFLFKVPPLRNIGLTAPYFHDGATATLEQAVFDTALLQLGLKISDQDVNDISAFLRTLNNRKILELPNR